MVQRAPAWRYFQLNANYFNQELGIYSKLDTDQLIPKPWRLTQVLDCGNSQPAHYPVFVKPEWGQNSFGIQRADNLQQLSKIRAGRAPNSSNRNSNYLIQNAAAGKREFEVFVIAATHSGQPPAVLSITETINHSDELYPINGIYNQATSYCDLSSQLSDDQVKLLWQHLSQIGDFRLSRVGIRANSLEALVSGDFQIIEINLLYPMPLIVLSNNCNWGNKIAFIVRAMWHLAAVTKTIPLSQPRKSVFFKKRTLAHRLKLSNKTTPSNEPHS